MGIEESGGGLRFALPARPRSGANRMHRDSTSRSRSRARRGGHPALASNEGAGRGK